MKKELCFVLGVIAGSTSVSATTTASDSTAVVCDSTSLVDQPIIFFEELPPLPEMAEPFTVAEEIPAQYSGGNAELMKWICANVEYPKRALEDGVQGLVIVKFVVEKDGSIGRVMVVRGKHPDLDREALRVVRRIPKKFIPARINGDVVSSWFFLPFPFKITQ